MNRARTLLERLAAGEVLVGDGAIGTMLMARGLPAGEPPERFNLTHPHIVEEVGRLYREAGADLLTTNTFGGSPARLADSDLEADLERLTRAAVRAAIRAAGGRALVSGSIGPCGLVLQPYGDADPGLVREGFLRQARALATSGADLFCVETMTDLAEACLAVDAAREAAPDLPVIATMTFERTRRGFFTVMGNSIVDAVRTLETRGATMIGSNCGNGMDAMVAIARECSRIATRPIAIQSNAGLPIAEGDGLRYPETPEAFAAAVSDLLACGVRLLGGCCGTTPAHVRALRAAVDAATPAG